MSLRASSSSIDYQTERNGVLTACSQPSPFLGERRHTSGCPTSARGRSCRAAREIVTAAARQCLLPHLLRTLEDTRPAFVPPSPWNGAAAHRARAPAAAGIASAVTIGSSRDWHESATRCSLVTILHINIGRNSALPPRVSELNPAQRRPPEAGRVGMSGRERSASSTRATRARAAHRGNARANGSHGRGGAADDARREHFARAKTTRAAIFFLCVFRRRDR
jgi:hypothetical protein